MVEIKMDSLNANPVNPNKNNLRFDYTTEELAMSTFEKKAAELFKLTFRVARETRAIVSFELSNAGDGLMIWIIEKRGSRKFDGVYAINDYDPEEWPNLAKNSEYNYRAAKCHLIRLLQESKRDLQ